MINLRQLITCILITVPLALAHNFDWNCANSLAPCNNACFAARCKGSPIYLNYDSNRANWRRRRGTSGFNWTPCTYTRYWVFGNSCDEYPFASTFQGGAGAILRCVDASEISSKGRQLDSFYRNLTNAHPFATFIRNYGGATFCMTNSCTNDGGEFELVRGKFVNARRTDSDQSLLFVPADSDSNDGTPFRKFMGSDGHERLWLAGDTTDSDSPVGQYVWDGEGEKVLITSEIPS